MKQNVRRALVISGMAIVIGTSGVAMEANAQTSSGARHWKDRTEMGKFHHNTKENFRDSRKHMFAGTIASVGENSFTLKHGNSTFTVNTDSNTRILDRKWHKISLSDIKTGDKVRVFGKVAASIITASNVRDISIK